MSSTSKKPKSMAAFSVLRFCTSRRCDSPIWLLSHSPAGYRRPALHDNPEPVRVVRSEEVLDRHRYRQGERTSHSTDHEWLWVATLPKQAFPTAVIRQLGHSRWKNENNGWMDLTKHWAFKHGFLHACRHRPKQTNASGAREPVSNHGLAAVTLILLIAFALTSAFVLRHSKLARQDHLTAIAVAAQLRAWVSKTPPPIRAPD
jgi:hypothetical protein